jgi:hypothetical protein
LAKTIPLRKRAGKIGEWENDHPNLLPVTNVEIGAAVGIYFGARNRRTIRIPTANPALYLTLRVIQSKQHNYMLFRLFDPLGTEFAIVQLRGMSIEELKIAANRRMGKDTPTARGRKSKTR